MKVEQLKALLETKDAEKIKDAFKTNALVNDIAKALSQYEISGHDVLNPQKRRDKEISHEDPTDSEKTITDGTVEVARLPLPFQKKTVLIASAFLGTPEPHATADGDEQATYLEAIEKVLDDNKFDYKFMSCLKLTKSERQCAILFYNEKLPTDSDYWDDFKFTKKPEYKIRMMVVANSLGDELYPVFDGTGNMIAFGRYYEVKEIIDGKDESESFLEIYTADRIIYYKKESDKWEETTNAVNIIGKIPVGYFYQPQTEWNDVQNLIDRLEIKISNHADTNDYYDSPIVKAKGKVSGFSEKGESGKVLQMDADADAEYMTYDNLPESMKLEMDNLNQYIHSFTHTPDISFENIKGLGNAISGFALKMLFMDAHLKAYDSEEIFGECAQRIFNYIKTALVKIVPDFKPSYKMRIKPKFTYFLPKNEQEEVTTIVSAYAAGIISLETAVKLNPLVEDHESELELIKNENEPKPNPTPPPIIPGE